MVLVWAGSIGAMRSNTADDQSSVCMGSLRGPGMKGWPEATLRSATLCGKTLERVQSWRLAGGIVTEYNRCAWRALDRAAVDDLPRFGRLPRFPRRCRSW